MRFGCMVSSCAQIELLYLTNRNCDPVGKLPFAYTHIGTPKDWEFHRKRTTCAS